MYVHHTYYIHKNTFIHLLENIWVIYQSNSNILQQVKGESVVLSHNGCYLAVTMIEMPPYTLLQVNLSKIMLSKQKTLKIATSTELRL